MIYVDAWFDLIRSADEAAVHTARVEVGRIVFDEGLTIFVDGRGWLSFGGAAPTAELGE